MGEKIEGHTAEDGGGGDVGVQKRKERAAWTEEGLEQRESWCVIVQDEPLQNGQRGTLD